MVRFVVVVVIGPRRGARRLSIAPLAPDLASPCRTAKPLRYFHSSSRASRSVGFSCTVSKKSSNLTWNCGEMWPGRGLSMSATDRAWLGDGPRYTPSLEQCLHLGAPCPLCRVLSSTYVGQPNAWKCRNFGMTCMPENFSNGESSSPFLGVALAMSLVCLMA